MIKKLDNDAPALRFPDFKGCSGWQHKKLKKITTKIGSGATPTGGDSNYKEYGISLFRSQNVYDGLFKIENLAFIDKEQAKKLDNVIVEKGDILLNITGASIARCCITPVKFLPARVNQHVMIIRPNSKDIKTEFLGLILICQNYKKKLFQLGGKGGSTREALTKEHIENFEILYPSIDEQEKIASFLGAVDARLTQLRRKRELLQTYKRGVMQKIFSQQIRFKQDDRSDFPEWEKKKLGEVFKRVMSKNAENNTNVLTISAQHGLINQRDFFNKSVSANDLTGYCLLNRGDFAYNKSYSNGYPMGAIKRLNLYGKGVVSSLYICFTNPNQIESRFYEQYFNGGFLNHELSKIAQEGARNHGLLNMSIVEFFKDIDIDYPTVEEQEKITNLLNAIDRKIEAVTRQIDLMEQFKKGLLQKMFV